MLQLSLLFCLMTNKYCCCPRVKSNLYKPSSDSLQKQPFFYVMNNAFVETHLRNFSLSFHSLHPAVSGVLQQLAFLFRILLPLPHLWYLAHRCSAGALQEPEFQQESGRQEWCAVALDQRTSPELLPHLPGSPCSQPSPRLCGVKGAKRMPFITHPLSHSLSLFFCYLSCSSGALRAPDSAVLTPPYGCLNTYSVDMVMAAVAARGKA